MYKAKMLISAIPCSGQEQSDTRSVIPQKRPGGMCAIANVYLG